MVIIRKLILAAILLAVFVLGWHSSGMFSKYAHVKLESPLGIFGSGEKNLPSDRIDIQNIGIYDDKIVIFVEEPYIAEFTDTHSMEPLFGKSSNGIEVVPKSASEIRAGDVISFEQNGQKEPIVHRVIETGYDEHGWYAVTKGDNNDAADEEKVRFEQVKRVLVGIIY